MFRTRMRWHNKGERSLKYYFALEKANASARTMTGVRNKVGSISRNCRKILKEQAKFYKKLFKFTLLNNSGAFVKDEDKVILHQPFTKEKFWLAPKDMNLGRSRGVTV